MNPRSPARSLILLAILIGALLAACGQAATPAAQAPAAEEPAAEAPAALAPAPQTTPGVGFPLQITFTPVVDAMPLPESEFQAVIHSIPGMLGKIAITNAQGLFLINADGSGWLQLRQAPAGDEIVLLPGALSPNSVKVAFSLNASRQIYIVNVDGSGLTQVAPEGMCPAWSPDGVSLAFRAAEVRDYPQLTGIFLLRPQGKSGSVEINGANGSELFWLTEQVGCPIWSPDGGQVAFAAALPTEQLPERYGIYRVNADGSSLELISSNRYVLDLLTWSPEGRRLAFVSDSAGESPDSDGIYLIDLSNGLGQRMRLTPSLPYQLSWSPDGQLLAFGADGLFVMRADAGPDGVTPLRLAPAIGGFSWSPDGSYLVYGDGGVSILSADGSNLFRLIEPGLEADGFSWGK